MEIPVQHPFQIARRKQGRIDDEIGAFAQRLHALALEEAARRRYETIRLYTPHGAARARAFYEREGWELAGPAFSEPLLGLDLVEYRRPL